MRYREKQLRGRKGLTLLEMVIAMAIITVVFSSILPLFRNVQAGWDARRGSSEMIQNGRVAMEHLNSSITKSARITAVSDSSDTDGYIEFVDNTGTTLRCDLAADNYIQFGPVGSQSELAGPVTSLKFICYALDDMDTATTDVDSIRFVKIDADFVNSATNGQDKTFTTQVFIRGNDGVGDGSSIAVEGSNFEFDLGTGETPAVVKIDNSHFLCAYTGVGNDGFAVVLTVDSVAETITAGEPFEFDDRVGLAPALAKIDDTHYLCAYTGYQYDGFAVVLTVNTSSWDISKETPFGFAPIQGGSSFNLEPALSKIDNANYLCAYNGKTDGIAVIFNVNLSDWTITQGTPYVYDIEGGTPSLSKIDDTHYLCSFESDTSGKCVVLIVDTASDTVTKGTDFTYDSSGGHWSDLVQLDATNYLCAYTITDNIGHAIVLNVNTSSWDVTVPGIAFEFGSGLGKNPSLALIDSASCIVAWDSVGNEGEVSILDVDTSTGTITKNNNAIFCDKGLTPDICNVEDTLYLCVYAGLDDNGWAVLFDTAIGMRP